MSDDLVKRLRVSWDADRSIISQTDNWMKERKEAADRIEELEAKLVKAVETFELADRNLTNLQPKIPQIIPPRWVPVIDGFVDPVITEVRATLAELEDTP